MATKKRGVLLLALGHSMYGQLAANLAASIKTNSPDVKVHLAWAGDVLKEIKPETAKALFDSMAEVPHDCYHHESGKRSYIKAKIMMYQLSPFDTTIFLDVDVILTPQKRFGELFDILGHLDFTMENRGRVNMSAPTETDTYLWGSIPEIKKAYDIDEGFLYALHSEFVFFKRNKRVREFFKTTERVFSKPKVTVKEFNGDLPDEFGFAIAMMKHQMYPHQCPYKPLYWQLMDNKGGTSLSHVIANFYGYSVGGYKTPQNVQKNYSRLARAVFYRLFGRGQKSFKFRPKRDWSATRKVL